MLSSSMVLDSASNYHIHVLLVPESTGHFGKIADSEAHLSIRWLHQNIYCNKHGSIGMVCRCDSSCFY